MVAHIFSTEIKHFDQKKRLNLKSENKVFDFPRYSRFHFSTLNNLDIMFMVQDSEKECWNS